MKIINYSGPSEAEKALEKLRTYGYNGYVRKTSPGGGHGCGFAVYVDSDNENEIRKILVNQNINN